MLVDTQDLTAFCADIFRGAGVPAEVAGVVADSLVYADLRGVGSHGVLRTEIYLRRAAEGMVDPHAEVRIERDGGSTLLVDGSNNFGAWVGVVAVDHAIARAKQTGACVVGVRRSNHFGTAAYFVERAIRQGCAAMVMSNASQTMAVTGGMTPFVGTNPVAFGFPTGREAPFILDMATSVVAKGKILAKAKLGGSIPEGWAIDVDGNPTTDAQAAVAGTVLPLGGAKGSGLSMVIDILSGVLTGAGYGPSIKSMYDNWEEPQDVGHFMLVVDIDRFLPLSAFTDRLADYIDTLKRQPRAPGVDEILHAGEPEFRLQSAASASGLDLPDPLVADLKSMGARYGLRWPEG
ncbi:Ldh family oxidoreductase [Azospirillum sp. RWY-5-1]|uniref:Ldh family oxidoreductase n=1 Tax=Azospirillum oleiclasticum TaxID=2735135 RepID=A0ABX2TI69_9PROT|nr:Ldh family oxidoreductase [Azospirillum oleiclasticum]NYZ15105.1 Ldh family oxidoreductase [Azospirillum oleiclasticum]NYZ22867.1 Ldh family oxidoreductase [Azospirillum oleiclasticum]